jgi:putative heme-binding domain-containing protein
MSLALWRLMSGLHRAMEATGRAPEQLIVSHFKDGMADYPITRCEDLMRVVAFLVMFGTGVLVAQQSNYTASDIEGGRQLYQANCTGCHGPDGDGVSGVNFASGRFRRGSSDDQLVRIIIGGIPGTAMPPSNFSEGQAGTIVAYMRSLSAPDTRSTSTAGDVARGRSIFEGRGQCQSCHSVGGVGSRVGPNLTDIGVTRRASELERSLLDPDSEVKVDNRTVRAVTREGAIITGRLLNQDTFSLQLLDSNERLAVLDKTKLREFAILKNSSMPSYQAKLTPQDLSDLVSYLVSLKGRQ